MDRAAGVTVRRLRAGETAQLRALRLRALADAPEAFGERFADIDAKPLHYWDELARSFTEPGRHVMFLAERDDDGTWVGMALGFRDWNHDDVVRLAGMWVDPASRRGGVARRLTEAVIDWARREGFRSVALWVADGNDAAATLYARCGFIFTGTRRPLESNPDRQTIEMARVV
jgi:GNAT superfamily N-acetyltransferase